ISVESRRVHRRRDAGLRAALLGVALLRRHRAAVGGVESFAGGHAMSRSAKVLAIVAGFGLIAAIVLETREQARPVPARGIAPEARPAETVYTREEARTITLSPAIVSQLAAEQGRFGA